jgi:hypothetical protein
MQLKNVDARRRNERRFSRLSLANAAVWAAE